MMENHSEEWHDAHIRATAWVKLNKLDSILEDDDIPEHLRERIWRFVQSSDAIPSESLPTVASDEWFDDPMQNSNWTQYCSLLIAKGKPDKAIQSIEESTRRIMNFLHDPKIPGSYKRYGLVVGRVQSGKTANYAGLISRAVDSGFDIIIVLAGLHNNLRRQTQIRLEKELTEYDSERPVERRLTLLTTTEEDFQTLPSSRFFNMGKESAVLLVVKKNVSPLTKLCAQLIDIPEAERIALNILVIDDEADHATINTKNLDTEQSMTIAELEEYDDDEDDDDETDEEITDTTKINSLIRQTLGMFTRSAYVGYTATPFANVLIDPDDDHASLGLTLYPRDFIIALPKPDGYSGLEDFFPAEESENDKENLSGQVTVVPRHDVIALRELDTDDEVGRTSEIPMSLNIAMKDFYLSGAARLVRESSPMNHTMLVHVKHTKKNQSPIYERIDQLVKVWREQIPNEYSSEGISLRNKFRERWELDFASNDVTNETWKEIEPALIRFSLLGVEAKLINSDTEDSLDYDNKHKQGIRVIAVGGNRLSRGLTLEGLCSTYFVRETKMYDTLTQMGRWFGFRAGYGDLVRLHTSGLLVEWFTWLTSVERALLSDIERYGRTGFKPTDLAVRILKHRAMLPTARNKMRHARIISGGLSASTPRMTRFLFHDPIQLHKNLENIAQFVNGLGDFNEKQAKSGTLLWRNVTPNVVLSLIQGHCHHPEDRTFDVGLVEDYIKSRLTMGELSKWSVALISTESGRIVKPLEEYGIDYSIGLPARSRIRGGDSIGELIQASNILIDLPGQTKDYMKNGYVSYSLMYEQRKPSNPLLLIYILDKESTPTVSTGPSRVALFPDDEERVDVVGLAIALPVNQSEGNSQKEEVKDYWVLEGVEHRE
jgi:hypothetical protein